MRQGTSLKKSICYFGNQFKTRLTHDQRPLLHLTGFPAIFFYRSDKSFGSSFYKRDVILTFMYLCYGFGNLHFRGSRSDVE